MSEQDDQGDREIPEKPETTDGGAKPRWSLRAQAAVLVLQGAAAVVDIVSGVMVLLHQA